MRKRSTIVVDFCCPRQARRKTPLAVVCVGGHVGCDITDVVDLGKQCPCHHIGIA